MSVSQWKDSYLRNGDHIHLALDANSAHLHLQAAQLAQTQVDRWKLVAELLIQLLLEVSRLHVLDDTRLNKVYILNLMEQKAGLGSRAEASTLNPFGYFDFFFKRWIVIFESRLDFQLIFKIEKGRFPWSLQAADARLLIPTNSWGPSLHFLA